MNYETITLTTDERGVARLTMNRPHKHNALNGDMIRELGEAAACLAADEKVRLVVLAGVGKSFCAGGDVQWFKENAEADPEKRAVESNKLAQVLESLNNIPKPLIGRVQGSAYGGGVGMISVCDIVVGVDDARFGLTEVRLGLIPATISPYVVARLGASNARATMLSGAIFSAAKAAAMGLLNQLVPSDGLDAAIDDIIDDHLEAAPHAVAETKQLIAYVDSNAIDDCKKHTAERLAKVWESNEGRTGINSFLNKERPPWRSQD